MGRIPSLEAPMQLSPNRLLGAAALTVCLAAAGCATSPGYANDGYYGANAPTGACYNDCGTVTRIEVISGGGSAVPNATGAVVGAAIGRAHVCTPVTNAHLVCRLLLE